MKDIDKGVVLPFPNKEIGIAFDMVEGPGLGFKLNVKVDELITVTEAAKMLGITKAEMKECVESQRIKKQLDNGYRYLLSKTDVESLII